MFQTTNLSCAYPPFRHFSKKNIISLFFLAYADVATFPSSLWNVSRKKEKREEGMCDYFSLHSSIASLLLSSSAFFFLHESFPIVVWDWENPMFYPPSSFVVDEPIDGGPPSLSLSLYKCILYLRLYNSRVLQLKGKARKSIRIKE